MFKKIFNNLIEFLDKRVFRHPFIGLLLSLFFVVCFVVMEKYSIWLRLIPALVLCAFILMMFFINKEPGIEYGCISKIFSGTLSPLQRRYAFFIALATVPFFVFTFAVNKYSGTKEIFQQEVQQHARVRGEPRIIGKRGIDYLARFNEKEFFENITGVRGYIVNRERRTNLDPDRLINLLHVYFRSVLLYPSPEMREYHVKGTDGKPYIIEFPRHKKTGKTMSVSLGEMSDTLLRETCSDLLNKAHSAHIIHLIDLFTRAMATPSLDKRHKFNILDTEDTVLKERFNEAIRMMPEEKAKEALDTRKNLIFTELRALNREGDKTYTENERNRGSLHDILIRWIQCRIDVLIANNKLIDIFKFLYSEIKENHDKKIITALLHNLVIYNNLFSFERKETIRDVLADCRGILGEEKYAQLNEMVNFSSHKITPGNIMTEPVELDREDEKFEGADFRKIRTVISFVINYKPHKDYTKFEYPNLYSIEFIRPSNLFDDPIFSFLNNLHQDINGMPTTIFSDAVGSIGHSTVVCITLQDFFHPDFDLNDGNIRYIDFKEQEASLGRRYYPHKDRIIEILREVHGDHVKEIPFDIKREEINISLVSNYLIDYIDESNRSIYRKVYTITDPDSYLKLKKRFLDKIAELNLSDEFQDIRNFLFESEIVTDRDLLEFINRALELTIKRSIEFHGTYRQLWKNEKFLEPLSDADIYPIIKAHLNPILEAKGVQIGKEVVAANGSLDFLCTYTSNANLFKVGIELKKAHHRNLVAGLTHQLPGYLKDKGSRQGIFLVNWFKNARFPQPKKYNSIHALISELERKIPKEHFFKITVIDCTRPQASSKALK